MAEVLLVSKAIAPPWNDSGKNLVRDLARGMSRHRPTLMVGRQPPQIPGAVLARVYDGGVGFAPGLQDQARVFGHLLVSRAPRLWHFFFAPNPRSCLAGGLAKRVRNKPALHTISSAPRDVRAVVPLLFADCNVVLSQHTERRFLEAGLAPSRLRRIPPAVEALTPPDDARRRSLRRELGLPESAALIVYPGDLEFGEGAHLMLDVARDLPAGALLVMACRAKTPRAKEIEIALREQARSLASRVQFVGETSRIHDLLATADVVALPSRDLYAKMDYPLVLLEAMSLARCVVVARGSAAEELARDDAACAVEVERDALLHTLTTLLADDARRARFGERGRARVQAEYDLASMAAAYERLYDELL